MTEEAKSKVEGRLAELTAEFNGLTERDKVLQSEIAGKQRERAAIRERQLQIQGAFAELKSLETSEPEAL